MKIKNELIRVGVVGLGRSGWDIHVRVLQNHSRYQIVAVCDPLTDRLDEAELKLGCVGYNEYGQFLKHIGLELVVIASPTKEHAWMAEEAIKNNLHVVLEKPLATTIQEIEKMSLLIKESDLFLSPYYNFRFKKDFLLIQSLLQEGRIGTPYLIRRHVGYFNRRDDWQSKLNEAGGILNAATIHHLDCVIQLVGQLPSEITCDLQRVVSKGDAPDHSKLFMRFPNRCVGDVEVSWVQALAGCQWLIYGPRGAIRQDGNTLTVKWFLEEETLSGEPENRSYLSGEQIQWMEQTYQVEEGMGEEYYELLAEALQRKNDPPVTLESAIDTKRIIERLLE